MDDKLGYINGYINNNGEVEKGQIKEVINTQIYPNTDDNTFRYGLSYKNYDLDYEEDTILGYDIVIVKDNSPIFNDSLKNSAKNFIVNYNNIPEIARRENMLSSFQQTFFKIFDGDFNSDIRNKSYYINKIEGLELLEKYIPDYDKDRIKITLKEDVTNISNYLRELYLNLSYSFKNHRYLIPSNCLRFDMKIKFSDYRRFRMVNDGGNTTSQINEKPSMLIYTLHDCNFIFNNSIIPQSLQMAGNTISRTESDLEFEITYKSVEKEILPYMVANHLQLNNKKTKIILNSEDVAGNREGDSNSNDVFKNVSNQKIYDKNNILNNSSVNSRGDFNPILYTNNQVEFNALNQIKYNAQQALERTAKGYLREIVDIRNSLLNNLIYEVSNFVKIPVTLTENVYNDLDIRTLLYKNLQARKVGDIKNEEAVINRKNIRKLTTREDIINDEAVINKK